MFCILCTNGRICFREFEEALKNCMTTSDPLLAYYRYIRWIEETHPAGKEKEIRELVNKCLTNLSDAYREKYTNDIRWLYIWQKFVSDLIFNHL